MLTESEIKSYTVDIPADIQAAQRASGCASATGSALSADDVHWVVNDSGELGVEIGGRYYFLYKGESLEYEDGKHDDGTPMLARRVGKREFGETQWPQKWITAGRRQDKYKEELVYTPGLSDGKPDAPEYQWRPISPSQQVAIPVVPEPAPSQRLELRRQPAPANHQCQPAWGASLQGD